MPSRPKRYCSYPGCREYAVKGSLYCQKHRPVKQNRSRDTRPSAAKRGYGREWQNIRKIILAEYGIPKERWPLYDVDHNPPYNPDVDPNHWNYELIPRLHSEHSRKTAKQDGGFGNPKSRNFEDFSREKGGNV